MSDYKQDVPLSVALLCLLIVVGIYSYAAYFRFHPTVLGSLQEDFILNGGFWTVSMIAILSNFAFLGSYIQQSVGLERQGSKLEILQGKRKPSKFGIVEAGAITVSIITYLISLMWVVPPKIKAWIFLLPNNVNLLNHFLSGNLGMLSGLILWISMSSLRSLKWTRNRTYKLDVPCVETGELILGSSPGKLSHEDDISDAKEEWVTIPGRGINTGILVTGSIGSGKTQGTILRYLKQILTFQARVPSILAIDPKGTFLKVAESMIRALGLDHLIVKIVLGGKVTINPIYCERPLKNSRFSEIAEMVRAAAINFMGKSSDSPFWDVSSSYLIRNSIVYCAATMSYYTLLDLYQTIVRANKDDLGEELTEALKEGSFDEEEQFNIGRAIEYFKNEYSQLEDRVRTGIVATSTAFINQFQEFGASRVFCPKLEDLTIKSMDELVKDGKIILFDVQKPGLSRSMGTFIKLLYSQAVLNNMAELKNSPLPVTNALIIDEYQDVVTCGGGGTLGDESFVAKSRESKSFFLAATQSVSSIVNAVGSPRPAMELLQNFRTRIACHSLDTETTKIFGELAGKDEYESETHSLSETSQAAKLNLLTGDFDSKNSNLNESISHSKRKEDLVMSGDFSRLRTFEAFAQVFDGIETKFLKLYLKPDFLPKINTIHEEVIRSLDKAKVKSNVSFLRKWIPRLSFASIFFCMTSLGAIPNVCNVVGAGSFNSCLELNVGACTCGFPPHPCASISYYVPQTYIEVWPNEGESYFSALPGAKAQLSKIKEVPFGSEGEDTQSYQARSIVIPFASMAFATMPARGTRFDKMCFDGMSEHFGVHWKTGKGDLLQPLFLAWGVAPKACLLKGAVMSASGGANGGYSGGGETCSFELPTIGTFPPSAHEACNGWGTFYPRYGTYAGPASLTGALMIASRIKSLSSEVLHSMPTGPDEKWQLIYPQNSSCFREGQNVGILETIKGVRETGRLLNGKLKGYLFAVWSKTITCQDFPSAIQAKAGALAIEAACRGLNE
ncbi:MAG TPA: type IV secretion system DNA-binding domain-containing protein [Bdellovibrio sp.]|uniref:type IV secretory system conjugative DNA transfer family protein n=1 Tax=Bdellovibrio sp. TaxID=28201 RepID=UPI002EF8131A